MNVNCVIVQIHMSASLTVSARGKKDDCEQLLWPHHSHLSAYGKISFPYLTTLFGLIGLKNWILTKRSSSEIRFQKVF